ncbi:MAG TPA: hypothetical protein VGD71_07720 [Kribbella sp.]|jgi:hypothetical protein
MRRLKWVSGIIWIWSWFMLCLEIFLWHHMTKSLHFNPPPPPPGTDIKPKAGGPLLVVLAGSAVAPPVFIAVVIVDWVRKRHVRLVA